MHEIYNLHEYKRKFDILGSRYIRDGTLDVENFIKEFVLWRTGKGKKYWKLAKQDSWVRMWLKEAQDIIKDIQQLFFMIMLLWASS